MAKKNQGRTPNLMGCIYHDGDFHLLRLKIKDVTGRRKSRGGYDERETPWAAHAEICFDRVFALAELLYRRMGGTHIHTGHGNSRRDFCPNDRFTIRS